MSIAAAEGKAKKQLTAVNSATNPEPLCCVMMDFGRKQVPSSVSSVHFSVGLQIPYLWRKQMEAPMNPPTRQQTERRTPNTTNPPWLPAWQLRAQPGGITHTQSMEPAWFIKVIFSLNPKPFSRSLKNVGLKFKNNHRLNDQEPCRNTTSVTEAQEEMRKTFKKGPKEAQKMHQKGNEKGNELPWSSAKNRVLVHCQLQTLLSTHGIVQSLFLYMNNKPKKSLRRSDPEEIHQSASDEQTWDPTSKAHGQPNKSI